jgi:hypothetical protein
MFTFYLLIIWLPIYLLCKGSMECNKYDDDDDECIRSRQFSLCLHYKWSSLAAELNFTYQHIGFLPHSVQSHHHSSSNWYSDMNQQCWGNVDYACMDCYAHIRLYLKWNKIRIKSEFSILWNTSFIQSPLQQEMSINILTDLWVYYFLCGKLSFYEFLSLFSINSHNNCTGSSSNKKKQSISVCGYDLCWWNYSGVNNYNTHFHRWTTISINVSREQCWVSSNDVFCLSSV